MCNHCPYVVHLLEPLICVARRYQKQGIAFIAVSSNDITTHPQDAPECMAQLGKEMNFPFPYCYDETQDVARAYHAACTPDFFLFNAEHRLVYRGQFDVSRPGNRIPVNGAQLTAALDHVISGTPLTEPQHPSMGCNIKWRSSLS